jgi:hypothetical protein
MVTLSCSTQPRPKSALQILCDSPLCCLLIKSAKNILYAQYQVHFRLQCMIIYCLLLFCKLFDNIYWFLSQHPLNCVWHPPGQTEPSAKLYYVWIPLLNQGYCTSGESGSTIYIIGYCSWLSPAQEENALNPNQNGLFEKRPRKF